MTLTIPQQAHRLDNLGEFYFSVKLEEIRKMNEQGHEVLNLGIGSPDLPPHPKVVEALTKCANQNTSHGYQGYKGIPELRQAVADFYLKNYQAKLSVDSEILPLMGSKEGIVHLSLAYLNPGDQVLVPNPGYATYTAAAKLAQASSVYYSLKEMNGFQPDIEELEKLDLSKVKIMWVNYPHMPTGSAADHVVFKKLVDFAKKHGIVLAHDNPYSFILNPEPKSILQVEGATDVTVELNSLSKSHNMAGWRVGMAVGNEEILSKMLLVKSNMDSGMFKGIQEAAVVALGLGQEWFEQLNETYTVRRKLVEDIFSYLNCEVLKNQTGMFVWARVPNITTGEKLADKVLRDARVFITPGFIFGSQGENFVRMSLCSDVETLLEGFKRIKNKL